MGRNTDSAHSTTQQTSLFVEKVHQTGRAVSNLITTKDRFFRPCVLNVQSTMLIKMLNFQYDLVVSFGWFGIESWGEQETCT